MKEQLSREYIAQRSYFFVCMLYADNKETFNHYYKKLTGRQGKFIYNVLTGRIKQRL